VGLIGSRGVRAATGVAMVLASLEVVRRRNVSIYEERAFRAANDAPDAIRIPVRSVMQAGTFVTVPIVAVLAAATGRRRLAIDLAAAGTLAWLGAKALKPLGGRGRPESLLPDVHGRSDPRWSPSWRPPRSVACTSGRTFRSTSSAAPASDSSCPRWCPREESNFRHPV
jgi:hypothetical protein